MTRGAKLVATAMALIVAAINQPSSAARLIESRAGG